MVLTLVQKMCTFNFSKICKFVFKTLGRGTRGTRVHVGQRRRFLPEICNVDFVEDWVLWLKFLLGDCFFFPQVRRTRLAHAICFLLKSLTLGYGIECNIPPVLSLLSYQLPWRLRSLWWRSMVGSLSIQSYIISLRHLKRLIRITRLTWRRHACLTTLVGSKE